MVKLFDMTYVFNHPWSVVTSAFWRKYPHPIASHIVSVDTIDRRLEPNGDLITVRIMETLPPLEPWMEKFYKQTVGSSYIYEVSTVNAEKKKMVIKSVPLTGNSLMEVEETCIYSEHPSDPKQTLYEQKASIAAKIPFFSAALENFSVTSLGNSSKNGVQIIEQHCNTINKFSAQALFNPFKLHLRPINPHLSSSSSASSPSSSSAASSIPSLSSSLPTASPLARASISS